MYSNRENGPKNISLNKVLLAADVYSMCIQHALSTEREEVMGLLIGEVNEEEGISTISAMMILSRSDKLPDRVEISPEQLYEGSIYAEKLTQELNKPMRVLGWYHSHPHITVWPSAVDVRTQSDYQVMDKFFVGLIFAVFQNEKNAEINTVNLTCFQAQRINGEWERKEIPFDVTESILNQFNLNSIAKLPDILKQEDLNMLQNEECKDDILANLHNNSLKTQGVVHVINKISCPMWDFLDLRLNNTKLIIKQYQKEREKLAKELKELQEKNKEPGDLLS